ncbi:hypothetical protein PQ469_05970 [Mucilaginibacter sp. KACC 22773]|uniref:hypothetical protein n=1 Tax=Mucilaginibacter sp. KACC 22773 TaxID=3025671 RepID=UPI0023656304|nr:hypothetical protein [Mucilaginibacter sp. KACC 22773]WDF79549.1 hypothetical protein PQ469_05970 [Mucilaginibacter sp. KACC 22773]
MRQILNFEYQLNGFKKAAEKHGLTPKTVDFEIYQDLLRANRTHQNTDLQIDLNIIAKSVGLSADQVKQRLYAMVQADVFENLYIVNGVFNISLKMLYDPREMEFIKSADKSPQRFLPHHYTHALVPELDGKKCNYNA